MINQARDFLLDARKYLEKKTKKSSDNQNNK
jgi:hypothetical protein